MDIPYLVALVSVLLFLYKWSMSWTIVIGFLIAAVGFLAILDQLQGSEAATSCRARPDRRENSLFRAVVLASAFQIVSVSLLAEPIAPVQTSKQSRKGPLKVFILAGQSNMQGQPEDSPNPGHGHHEFGNAETCFLVGDALGNGMKKLLTPTRRNEKPASPKPISNTVRHIEN